MILEQNIALDTTRNDQQQQDPNAILNEYREIDKGVDATERNLDKIKAL